MRREAARSLVSRSGNAEKWRYSKKERTKRMGLGSRPLPTNAIVGWEGSGDASALPIVYLKMTPGASGLFDLFGEWEGLCDEVRGCFKGEEPCVNQEMIKFGPGAI